MLLTDDDCKFDDAFGNELEMDGDAATAAAAEAAMAATVDSISGNSKTNLHRRLVDELLSCRDYWLRRSRMLTITKRAALTDFQADLIRLEVALHFNDLDEATSKVVKIHSCSPPDSLHVDIVNDLLRQFLGKLTSHSSKAVRKMNADTLANLCLQIYPEAMQTHAGRLALFARLALINPVTLKSTAANMWSDFLTVVRDFMPLTPSDSQFTVTPYDLILLNTVPALIKSGFGNLSPAITLDVYRRVLASTLFLALDKIPQEYYEHAENEAIVGLLAPPDAFTCWKNCTGFIAAIYWRLVRVRFANRHRVTEILCAYAFGDARPTDNVESWQILPKIRFRELAYALLAEKTDAFDVTVDADVVHLLVFHAFAMIAKHASPCSSLQKVFVSAPPYFCDASTHGVIDYWRNEDISIERDDAPDESIPKYISDNIVPDAPAFSVLCRLDTKFSVLDRMIPLFDDLLGVSSRKTLYISSTLLQAHMYHANYEQAFRFFNKYEQLAADDFERQMLRLQYLQICMSVQRRNAMREIRGCRTPPLPPLALNSDAFWRCIDFVVERLRANSAPADQSRLNHINCTLISLVKTIKKNCYIEISDTVIPLYSAMCVLQILFCDLLSCLYKISRDTKLRPELSANVDFLNAFLLCTIQLLIDEPVGASSLEGLFAQLKEWGQLNHPGLLSYISSHTICSYIFGFDEQIKLRLTKSDSEWETGAQLFQRVLKRDIVLSARSHADDFAQFVADHRDAIDKIFEFSTKAAIE